MSRMGPKMVRSSATVMMGLGVSVDASSGIRKRFTIIFSLNTNIVSCRSSSRAESLRAGQYSFSARAHGGREREQCQQATVMSQEMGEKHQEQTETTEMDLGGAGGEEALGEVDGVEAVCAGGLAGERGLERGDSAERVRGVVADAAVVGVARARGERDGGRGAEAELRALREHAVQRRAVVAQLGDGEPARERDVVEVDRVVRELRAHDRRVVEVQHHHAHPRRGAPRAALLMLLLSLLLSLCHATNAHKRTVRVMEMRKKDKKGCRNNEMHA